MNKFIGIFYYKVWFVAGMLVVGCSKSSDLKSLGSVKLASLGTSSIALKIPQSLAQPYRLEFQSPGTDLEKMNEIDGVEVFLENNDTLPLIVYLDSIKSNITISPSSSERIFTGSVKGLLLAGNSKYENFTIRSSNDRVVNATLKFVRLTGDDSLTIEVRAWRINYGL